MYWLQCAMKALALELLIVPISSPGVDDKHTPMCGFEIAGYFSSTN